MPKAGHFGTRAADGAFVFSTCPPGYCIETNGGGSNFVVGTLYAQCAAGANRDWTVPLCGACLPGYSQSLSNANCVADGTCHGTALWFWPASALYCAVYSVYFLWSSKPSGAATQKTEAPRRGTARYRLLLAAVQRSALGMALAGGSINVIAFFFQMAGVVMPAKGAAATIGSALKSFFGMQVGGSTSGGGKRDGGFCIWAGMSALAKIEIHYAVPFAMAVVLCLLVALGSCARKGSSAAANLRARFPGAVAELALLAYATLSSTTLQLLDCVDVPSSLGAPGAVTSVLFLAGDVQCGAWQAPLYAFLALLVALPAVPVFTFCARQLPQQWWLARKAHAAQFPAHPTAQALRNSICKAYRDDAWHWPALLALQRFAMVATPIFVADTLESSVTLALIAFLALLLHTICASPFAHEAVNTHQKIAATCLATLAVLNVPQETLLQASVDVNDATEAALKTVCDRLDGFMAVVLLAPVLLPLLWMALGSVSRRSADAKQLRTPLLGDN